MNNLTAGRETRTTASIISWVTGITAGIARTRSAGSFFIARSTTARHWWTWWIWARWASTFHCATLDDAGIATNSTDWIDLTASNCCRFTHLTVRKSPHELWRTTFWKRLCHATRLTLEFKLNSIIWCPEVEPRGLIEVYLGCSSYLTTRTRTVMLKSVSSSAVTSRHHYTSSKFTTFTAA